MKIRAHADDFGLSRQISKNILACFDHGVLDSTSLIVNGYDSEASVSLAKEQIRKGLVIHLHLNLMEGKPISSPESVDLLINAAGEFKYSFAGLWWRYLMSNSARKKSLAHQIRKEIRAQILRFNSLLPEIETLSIDSHQHYHVIPVVRDQLLSLAQEFSIQSIRVPREPFFLRPLSLHHCGIHLGINVIKHTLLNLLSNRILPKLKANEIAHNQHFLGVLCTGNMSFQAVETGLRTLSNRHSGEIEILFHPGGTRPSEYEYWKHRPELKRYYASANRQRERDLLMNPSFGELLQSVRSEH